jgi:NADH-quinone oxidoreductase subunit A
MNYAKEVSGCRLSPSLETFFDLMRMLDFSQPCSKLVERRRIYFMQDFGAIGFMICVAIVFPIVPLIISRFLQPRRPTSQKLSTYECGIEPIGRAWVQFKASYFLYALVFVVFDVETVFLYPWAVQFRSLGLFAVVEMLVFMGILLIGLAYAWKKGALEWK